VVFDVPLLERCWSWHTSDTFGASGLWPNPIGDPAYVRQYVTGFSNFQWDYVVLNGGY